MSDTHIENGVRNRILNLTLLKTVKQSMPLKVIAFPSTPLRMEEIWGEFYCLFFLIINVSLVPRIVPVQSKQVGSQILYE